MLILHCMFMSFCNSSLSYSIISSAKLSLSNLIRSLIFSFSRSILIFSRRVIGLAVVGRKSGGREYKSPLPSFSSHFWVLWKLMRRSYLHFNETRFFKAAVLGLIPNCLSRLTWFSSFGVGISPSKMSQLTGWTPYIFKRYFLWTIFSRSSLCSLKGSTTLFSSCSIFK